MRPACGLRRPSLRQLIVLLLCLLLVADRWLSSDELTLLCCSAAHSDSRLASPMQAATCDRLSSDDSTGQLELQLHKQHEMPQIVRANEARVRIHASCLDEWDIRVRSTMHRGVSS